MPNGRTSDYDEAVGNAGRPLDRAGRRAAIEAALMSRPGESNRTIAADLGVSDHTVSTVRESLEATAQIAQFDGTLGRDGKTRRRPPQKPKAAPAATAADLAALAAAIKRDREIDNARFFALERSDAENRKLLGREPPAPTPGSEWVFVKEAAGLAGRSESAVWNWIKRGHIKPLTSPTGRTIVRISDLPAKRTAGEKCE
jgi:hypothetical protein